MIVLEQFEPSPICSSRCATRKSPANGGNRWVSVTQQLHKAMAPGFESGLRSGPNVNGLADVHRP